MVALTDPGLLVVQVSPQPFVANVSPVPQGVLLSNDLPVSGQGIRNTAALIGILVSPTDNFTVSEDLTIPGYALRKGLRVMTLVDDQRVAYRNVVN